MKEEEIKKKVGELEIYRLQLDTLAKQDEILRINIEEFMRARDTLQGIKENKKGDKILVPIGANFFVHAKIDDVGKGISNLGSTVAAEENINDALKRLDKHINELNKAGQELANKVTELEARNAALTQELQEAYAELEEKKEE
jgi:prefoldin alpha subunit